MQYERKAIKYGDSVGITIPVDLTKFLSLNPGDTIVIQDESGKHGKYMSIWKKSEKTEE